ncbi:hypothetical protein QOZ80_9AG0685680 [Eleusine coracana subsp. coracana]|nr:hypothetical protein QOZ80_9AG0685680 [Eleusine coracana subsp. coracana]
MQGVLSRVRGPFTLTQWMELERQALIYKHFAANVPVPSSLLVPITRSLNPWSTFGSNSLGWAQFRPGCADVEQGRCRRTDGKKWRCSRDAVGDQRYCERHINYGRYRSRKHVEGQKATPTIAGPAMVVSTPCHSVAWQKQLKSSSAHGTNPFPGESSRNFLDKHNNMQDNLSVSTSMDSFDSSVIHSSTNCEKVALSAVVQHDYDQMYSVHEAGILAAKSNESQESQLFFFRETIDDGPLGEVFIRRTCQPVYAETDE